MFVYCVNIGARCARAFRPGFDCSHFRKYTLFIALAIDLSPLEACASWGAGWLIERQNENRRSQHKTVKGRAASCFYLNPTLTPSDKIGGEMCGTSKVFAVPPRPLGDRLQHAAARRHLVFGFICGVENQNLRTSAFKGSSRARDICLDSDRTVALRVAGVQTQTRMRTWTAADADVPWTWTCRGHGRAVDADVPWTRTRLGRGRQRIRAQLGRGSAKSRADADVHGRGRATDADATRTRTFCP